MIRRGCDVRLENECEHMPYEESPNNERKTFYAGRGRLTQEPTCKYILHGLLVWLRTQDNTVEPAVQIPHHFGEAYWRRLRKWSSNI